MRGLGWQDRAESNPFPHGAKLREAGAKSKAISFSKDTYTGSSLKPVSAVRVVRNVHKIWVRKHVLFAEETPNKNVWGGFNAISSLSLLI